MLGPVGVHCCCRAVRLRLHRTTKEAIDARAPPCSHPIHRVCCLVTSQSVSGSPVAGTELIYKPYLCEDGPTKEVVRIVVPKISASFSLLGSSFIVATVGQQRKTNPASVDPYQRIMAAYSLYDILFSFFEYFLGSWMTPTKTGWWGAVGNAATCSMQGFFQNFGALGSAVSVPDCVCTCYVDLY